MADGRGYRLRVAAIVSLALSSLLMSCSSSTSTPVATGPGPTSATTAETAGTVASSDTSTACDDIRLLGSTTDYNQKTEVEARLSRELPPDLGTFLAKLVQARRDMAAGRGNGSLLAVINDPTAQAKMDSIAAFASTECGVTNAKP